MISGNLLWKIDIVHKGRSSALSGSDPRRPGRSMFRAGNVLIIIGVLILLFPLVQNAYYRHVQLRSPDINTPSTVSSSRTDQITEQQQEEYPEKLVSAPGVLEIPALDLNWPWVMGWKTRNQGGAGFYPQSGYPDTGNVSIAGHRNAYGSPFRHLDKLEEGDEIRLYYRDKTYNYTVDTVFETHNRDWSVIEPTPRPALTLTTCTPVIKPVGKPYNRLIVRAYLDKEAE